MKKEPTGALPSKFESEPDFQKWDFMSVSLHTLLSSQINSLHFHKQIEIGKCISGGGICFLGDKQIPFNKDCIQIIPPSYPHYNIYTTPDTIWYFISIDITKIKSQNFPTPFLFLHDLIEKQIPAGVWTAENVPGIDRILQNIIDIHNLTQTNIYTKDVMILQIYSLLLNIAQLEKDDTLHNMQPNEHIGKILPGLRLATSSTETNKCIRVEDMASACSLSLSHFRRLFTEITGEPPKQYLDRMQMEKAARLLTSTNLSLVEIALAIGIEEPSTFYRKFVKHYGCSPNQFKKDMM